MPDNGGPLISIITPCYNGARYLDDYFAGVLSQKHRNIELIFVNDGYTSERKERYSAFFGWRIKKTLKKIVGRNA